MASHEATNPPTEQAFELPLERLAMLLLRAVDQHYSICNRNNVAFADAWCEHVAHPLGREFLAAISEAFNWLERQGLASSDPGQSGEWMMVTRRGKEALAAPNGLGHLAAEARLGLELHDRLGARVRQLFNAGDFEMAAVRAMREVDMRVRELAGLPTSLVGVDLMKQTFRVGGPEVIFLADLLLRVVDRVAARLGK